MYVCTVDSLISEHIGTGGCSDIICSDMHSSSIQFYQS